MTIERVGAVIALLLSVGAVMMQIESRFGALKSDVRLINYRLSIIDGRLRNENTDILKRGNDLGRGSDSDNGSGKLLHESYSRFDGNCYDGDRGVVSNFYP